MKLAGKIIVPGVGAKGDVLKKKDRLKEAYELGRRLVQKPLTKASSGGVAPGRRQK